MIVIKCRSYHIAEFVGKNRGCDLCIIELWIVIPPCIVFLFAELAVSILHGNRSPCADHLGDMCSVLVLTRIYTKDDLTVPVLNGEAVAILQGKQGVHQSRIAVDIGDA